jgi:hypothetical protein
MNKGVRDMKPILVPQPRFEQPTAVMMLDNAEVALTLVDLAATTAFSDERRKPVPPAPRPEPPAPWPDAACEVRSAARLVLDPDEAEALQKELDEALRPHHPKAA